ncbi:MAG: hypothetical protein LBU66_03465, partial [Treponema sp.]|nr:hypothetical protein [Treponema sp.]
MKNLFFFIVVVFLFFSCAGTPEPGEELPEETEFEEVLEELEITDDNELENIDNALVFEEILEREADDFVNDVFDDGIEDDTEDDTGVEFSSEEDAVVIEERLSSIEESLSNIEERLALIADALINAQATPLPETTVPVVEVPAPTAPVVPPAPVEAVQPQEPMPSVAQPPDDDSAPSEPPPTREPVREAPPLVSVLRDFPPVPALPAISPREDEVVFSRIVRATVGQMIEIPFRGTNWVYLGELASRRGVELNSSRREPEGQSFVFRAESEGAYVLKFFREDFLRGYIINDHVQVIVGEAAVTGTGWFNPPFDRGRVVAEPRWPS